MVRHFLFLFIPLLLLLGFLSWFWAPLGSLLVVIALLFGLGIYDMTQTKHTVIRNFPIIGRFRYMFEAIRPEINQYFVESDQDGRPFSREHRSVVYQRSKRELDTQPFGTRLNVYNEGYEWINHSLNASTVSDEAMRVTIGNEQCSKPYTASLFNISAMSFGSLSPEAVMALNRGAKTGGFSHNTGEGGISPYHLKYEGDLVWQIGTGYFGCRDEEGGFDPEKFVEKVAYPQVKMIEIKLSQGAKPAHGGILPADKLTPEICEIRGVSMGKDVLSPPMHKTFSTPRGLLEFVAHLRELSKGKPVGFKLCLGSQSQFLSICKAMLDTKIYPDFITVDGAEGGTGAAPLEFANHVGSPLSHGIVFIHNALVGTGLRDKIKIICSARIITGFHLISRLAIGADLCNSARGMMLSLGCIQALRCHSNKCPTGVATQQRGLRRGLVIEDKYKRVANYHRETINSVRELLGAAGLQKADELRPYHISRRISQTEVKTLDKIYPFLEPNELLEATPEHYFHDWTIADPDKF